MLTLHSTRVPGSNNVLLLYWNLLHEILDSRTLLVCKHVACQLSTQLASPRPLSGCARSCRGFITSILFCICRNGLVAAPIAIVWCLRQARKYFGLSSPPLPANRVVPCIHSRCVDKIIIVRQNVDVCTDGRCPWEAMGNKELFGC